MRKIINYIIVIAILAGGYFGYLYWFDRPQSNPWHFIPKNAAAVLETSESLSTYEAISKSDIWKAFESASFAQQIEQGLFDLDSLNTVSLRETFNKVSSLIAFFPISVSDLDVLLVAELKTSDQRNYLTRSISVFKELGYRYKTRSYNGFTIEELYSNSQQGSFSFIRFQNQFVGSFSPFLVEDAIRSFIDSETNSFSSSFPETRLMKPLDLDEGNLYINMSGLESILNLFPNENQHVFGKSAFLDLAVDSSSFKLTGFTFPEDDLLSTFSGGPGSFDLLDVVPNNTAKLVHYSFQDSEVWRVKLNEFDSEIKSTTDLLKSKYDIDIDFLFGHINQEIGVADLEVVRVQRPDRLIFFDTKNMEETCEFLNQAAIRMAPDSVFSDRVGNYVLQKMDANVARALLGNRSALEKECYFMIHRKYVIMSNSLAKLKRLIKSLELDNTWRRSLLVNNLLDQSNREANYSMLVHVPRSWNQLMNELKPAWRSVFEANEVGFKSLEYLSLQFSKVDEKFYTNVLAYQPEPPMPTAKINITARASFGAGVTTKPYLFRSHLNQALEVLIQDSLSQLYHVSSDFDIIWANRLPGPIVGAIQPVDFYKNNKRQYTFCTNYQLHIVDRTGTYIDGFPVTIPGNDGIDYFSVVDYDGSKNYRYMITNSKGDIYLLDKSGKSLPGWAPNKISARLIAAPRHIRVAGKDAFIILKENGTIDLINRRGQSNAGFPVELKTDVVEGYFTEATGSFETSRLSTLTEDGEIIRINFTGQVEFREQLFKPDANTSFRIVPDVLNNDFIIIRSSRNLWEVLDSGGAKLFEKTYITNEKKIVQYYRFGGGKDLILVTNPKEKFLTIYTLDGSVLNQSPIKSSNPVSVLFSENRNSYTIYTGYDKVVVKIEVK